MKQYNRINKIIAIRGYQKNVYLLNAADVSVCANGFMTFENEKGSYIININQYEKIILSDEKNGYISQTD